MQLIVLGMHRSGTSAVTGLLHQMGAYLGPPEALIATNGEGPKGLFQRRDVCDLHESVLHALGCDWWKLAGFDLDRLPEEARREFDRGAADVIRELDMHRPWVVTDPRLCLLLPLWRGHLKDAAVVFVHRNPLEVARSLEDHDRFPVELGLALWERYGLAAAASARGLPCLAVSYADLMHNPAATANRLLAELGIAKVTGLRQPTPEEVCAVVKAHVVEPHCDGQPDTETPLSEYLNPRQLALYDCLARGRFEEIADLQLSRAAQEQLARADRDELEVRRLTRQLVETRKLQQHTDKELRRLHIWLVQLSGGIRDLEAGRRWRIGSLLADLWRRLRLRPRMPAPELVELHNALDRFQRWQEGRPEKAPWSKAPQAPAAGTPSLTTNPSAAGPRAFSVDIVICVHNALSDVRRCLEAVERHTRPPYRVILVDDGSEEACASFVRDWAAERPGAVLLRSEQATGYTRAANRGLRAAHAPWVVLLNSDTVVTPLWLERMLQCAQSDPRIGIVGPLSNAASWQSVPERFGAAGDWAVNPLPPGWSANDMASLVAQASVRRFPRVGCLNGFCLLIARTAIERIGFLDEDAFPFGFGEENDYCFRAVAAGFSLAVADHAYVYHAKSKSYSHERRRALSKTGGAALEGKHGARRVRQVTRALREEPVLAKLRRQLADLLQRAGRLPDAPAPLRVLFLLPVPSGGGGVHSVVQEALGMRSLGLEARVAIPRPLFESYLASYAAEDRLHEMLLCYANPQELHNQAQSFDAVVGTIFHSMKLVKELVASHPHLVPAYYVQDYEPWFFPEGTAEWREAVDSYQLVPGTTFFAKTEWLCGLVRARHGVAVHKVRPSLDHRVYYPAVRARANGEPVRLTAMIRPRTARRGPARTMRVLGRLQRDLGALVEVHIFGCDQRQLKLNGLQKSFAFDNHGELVREEVADLLRQCEVFLDLSDYQAFGRTGLEAMACGCVPVLPLEGGAHEYAVPGANAVLVDTRSEQACYEAVSALAQDKPCRQAMQRQAVETAAGYSILRAALSEIAVLERACQARRAGNQNADGGRDMPARKVA